MLVSRLSDTEQSHWSYTKFETTYQKPTGSPRMSNHFDTPLSTQPDWQGQYSYLPPGESNLFSQPFESGNDNTEASRPRAPANGTNSGLTDVIQKESNTSPLDQKRTVDPLGIRSTKPSTPPTEHQEPHRPDSYSQKPNRSASEESLGHTDAPNHPMPPKTLHTSSSAGHAPEGQTVPLGSTESKEDEDDILDDEEMGGADGVHADSAGRPQTTAERTAQRRKMKRFR